MSEMEKESIDIRSTLGQELDYYEKRTYKPDYAIAEFVDNSIQSYLTMKPLLKLIDSEYRLKIEINYDINNDSLEIKDNAGGMTKEVFRNALILGNKPTNLNGLNEFGYGLKTAASWFGKTWSVKSKSFNSNQEFLALVDIKKLLQTNDNSINIETNEVDNNDHYTIVKITSLIKKISKHNINKIFKRLSSLYRKFLINKEIIITFNGQELNYTEPEFLTTKENNEIKTWKQEFNDSVLFNGQIYQISGYVGLLKDGSYKKTGLTLIRRKRVIMGGNDEDLFRPEEIFGVAGSTFTSFRLIGEIEMDNWPVTQAKDNFDWDLNGLKEAFIDKIKEISKDYIHYANEYRVKDTKKVITVKNVQGFADETIRNIKSIDPNLQIFLRNEKEKIEEKIDTEGNSEIFCTYPLTIFGNDYNITIRFFSDSEQDLINIKYDDSDIIRKIEISFNTACKLFSNLNEKPMFINAMQKFFVGLVIARQKTLKVSNDGINIDPNILMDNLNQTLYEMSKDNDLIQDNYE